MSHRPGVMTVMLFTTTLDRIKNIATHPNMLGQRSQHKRTKSGFKNGMKNVLGRLRPLKPDGEHSQREKSSRINSTFSENDDLLEKCGLNSIRNTESVGSCSSSTEGQDHEKVWLSKGCTHSVDWVFAD